MGLEIKICKMCGKREEMASGCDTCLACRVKLFNSKYMNTRRRYYIKNREAILEKAKARREKKIQLDKEGGKIHRLKPEPKNKRSRWTVEYIKTGDGYSWRAWFRNPATDRLVKFESARVFIDILAAKNDYSKATR